MDDSIWIDLKGVDQLVTPPTKQINSLDPSTIAAWGRASSEHCKQTILRVGRDALLRNVSAFQTMCPQRLRVTPGYKFLGCFKFPTARVQTILSQKFHDVATCVTFCFHTGIRFALIASDATCICDNTKPADEFKASLDKCKHSCSPFNQDSVAGGQLLCGSRTFVLLYDTAAIPPFHDAPSNLLSFSGVPDNQPIRIVYLLVWHGRGWFQTRRLFDIIYHPRHYYCIHVDSRSQFLYRRALQLAQRYPDNVYVVEQRFAANWGSFNLLDMMLTVMQHLSTNLTRWRWDFLINLSGSDLPVRPRDQLVTYLSAHRGKLFFGVNLDQPSFLLAQGINRIFVDCDHYVWQLGRRSYPFGLVFDGGSDWMVLPRDFVRYVALTEDRIYRKLLDYFRYSLLPAEMFFHVIAQNTHFCTSVINYGLRYTHWDRPRGCDCKYNTSVDWCGCSPVAFRGMTGLRRLCGEVGGCLEHPMRSSSLPVFFARKFDSTVDLHAINFVVSNLLGLHVDAPESRFYMENIFSAPESDELYEVSKPTAHLLRRIANHLFSFLFKDIWSLQHRACTDRHLNVYALFDANDQTASNVSSFPLLPIPKLLFQTPLFDANATVTAGSAELLAIPPSAYYATAVPLSKSADGDILYAEVTSMFDTKEQFSRNYPRLLFPHDKLQLVFYWKAGQRAMQIKLQLVNSTCPTALLMLLRRSNAATAFGCAECILSVMDLRQVFPDCLFSFGYSQIVISSPSNENISVPFFIHHPDSTDFANSPWFSVRPLDVCLQNVENNRNMSRKLCSLTPWSSLAWETRSFAAL